MGASREGLAELVRNTVEEFVSSAVEAGIDMVASLASTGSTDKGGTCWNVSVDEVVPDDSISIEAAGTQLATAIAEMEEQIISNKKLNRTEAIQAAVDGTVRIITVGTPEIPPMHIKPNQILGERLLIRSQKEAPELLKELQLPELRCRDIWPNEFNIGDHLGERIKLARVELGKLAEEMIQD